jgi:hypothetical protein
MALLERWRKLSGWEKALLLIFLGSLPLVNPWVRGDGVGYYAYARAPLIEHSLNFEKDWQGGNQTFRMGKIGENSEIPPRAYTSTGHVDNHFTVGPALLWMPFLLLAHAGVLVYDALGGHVVANGFSKPYVVTMALATALYGFCGLWLSFCVARRYVAERWAFLGTLGIWLGSSLLVYMYFNPSWSHAHSAFAVALFLWYWQRTREGRTYAQWAVLGLCSGLMVNIYYPNALFLLLPAIESLAGYLRNLRSHEDGAAARRLLAGNMVYTLALLAALLPTFITRQIVYGHPFKVGSYTHYSWNWTSPVVGSVLFSSDHGLFSWTPLLLIAVLGFLALRKRDPLLAGSALLAFCSFLYLIASYPYWDGLSSFGNRFFISFTPFFVLGLAAALAALAARLRVLRPRVQSAFGAALVAVFVVWNLGLVFQWGTHMIPVRGSISFREMAYNQVSAVPLQVSTQVRNYLFKRKALMGDIEQKDVDQLKARARSAR